jgi:hypothetical protein
MPLLYFTTFRIQISFQDLVVNYTRSQCGNRRHTAERKEDGEEKRKWQERMLTQCDMSPFLSLEVLILWFWRKQFVWKTRHTYYFTADDN